MDSSQQPGLFDKLKSGITGAVAAVGQKASDLQKQAFGDNAVTNGDKLSKVMGAPVVPDKTIVGGRRYRKKTSKRHSKKHKKTMRRKH